MFIPYTREAEQALEQVRNISALQWSVLPLVAVLLYVYAREIQEKNYNTLFTCLAFA